MLSCRREHLGPALAYMKSTIYYEMMLSCAQRERPEPGPMEDYNVVRRGPPGEVSSDMGRDPAGESILEGFARSLHRYR